MSRGNLDLGIHVAPSAELPESAREAIFALCERAYGEDLRETMRHFNDPVHVLATVGGAIVSHALWITRWLAAGAHAPLRTAYVEAVATDPAHQGRGYGSAVMRTLVDAVSDFELAALAPSDQGLAFYNRLGWQTWTGPLFIRRNGAVIESPGELVMIHRLAATPALDLNDSLSAEWRRGEPW